MSDEVESAEEFGTWCCGDGYSARAVAKRLALRDRQIWNAAIRAAAEAAKEEWDSVPEPAIESAVLALLKPGPKE